MLVAPALIPKRSGERIKTNRRDAVTLNFAASLLDLSIVRSNIFLLAMRNEDARRADLTVQELHLHLHRKRQSDPVFR